MVLTLVPVAVSRAPALRDARAWGKVRLLATGEPSPVVVTVPPVTVTVAPMSARMPMALSLPWVVTVTLSTVAVEFIAAIAAE
ncbi:hypothetical protein D3C81_1532010 [compost metagenome]